MLEKYYYYYFLLLFLTSTTSLGKTSYQPHKILFSIDGISCRQTKLLHLFIQFTKNFNSKMQEIIPCFHLRICIFYFNYMCIISNCFFTVVRCQFERHFSYYNSVESLILTKGRTNTIGCPLVPGFKASNIFHFKSSTKMELYCLLDLIIVYFCWDRTLSFRSFPKAKRFRKSLRTVVKINARF